MLRRFLPVLLLLALGLFNDPQVFGLQGCSLCKDTTAGSAPRAQAALRKAILILGIPAGGVFVGILLLARQFSPRDLEGEDSADRKEIS